MAKAEKLELRAKAAAAAARTEEKEAADARAAAAAARGLAVKARKAAEDAVEAGRLALVEEARDEVRWNPHS